MNTIPTQQPGLFDYDNRMKQLDRGPDPLARLNARIDWTIFRQDLERAGEKEARGPGGRPRHDVVRMFKVLVLQRYDNLSDEQTEYQINDRLSFQKFLGLTLSDSVPDQNTSWLFREVLIRRGQVKPLFRRFETHLNEAGLMGHEGKMIDASCVEVPRQRNSREENAELNQGKGPESNGTYLTATWLMRRIKRLFLVIRWGCQPTLYHPRSEPACIRSVAHVHSNNDGFAVMSTTAMRLRSSTC